MSARRSRGTGRLFIQADRNGRESWYGSWWAGDRRIKKRIGLKRVSSAREGLTRVQAEAELRKLIDSTVVVPREQRLTIEQAGRRYIDHLEKVMQRKPTTIQDYRIILRRHLAPFFAERTIDRITVAQCEQLVHAQLDAEVSVKSLLNRLTFLHGIFAFAVKRGWCVENPMARVDRPRQARASNGRLRYLDREQLALLLAAVPSDGLGAIERPLYLCAAMTGLRQGELIALRWRDVDWNARLVRVVDNYTRGSFCTPKSERSVRSVPMAPRLEAELRAHHARSAYTAEDDLVFCHPQTGGVYDASRLRKRFQDALARGGVREITFHELRHTFGTQMAAAGAPLRAIQEWMGHADYKTTSIYAHYAPDPTRGAKWAEAAFGEG